MAKISKEEYQMLKSLDDDWKWIARDSGGDYGGNLYVYTEKPFKCYDAGEWDCGMGILFIGTHRFQFIQWEDEEPHNIAELIKEYEFGKILLAMAEEETVLEFESESEESEVKKDKKWLLDKWTKERNETDVHNQMYQFASEFIADINQLDEPEVLSSDWIKDNQLMWTSIRGAEYYVPSNKLYGKIMPKQELPVIPKFVAEWIEVSRKATYHLLGAVYDGAYNEDMKEWLFKGDKRTRQDNQDKLTRAWLDGFTVEEEQKYFAKIKGHENIGSDDKYWSYCITDESLEIGGSKVHADVLAEYVLSATKDEWENLGINDDNADFVEVEELEE